MYFGVAMRKILSLLLLAVFFIFIGCQKEIREQVGGNNNNNGNGNGPTPTQVTTTIKILVLNPNGVIVSGAKVQAGNTIVYSNEFGYAELKNVQVPTNKAIVKVSATGFFDAYRTFAADNNECFGKVKLLPYKISGNIASSAGGTVSIGTEATVSFPPNSFMLENGTEYTGNVSIYGAYINPESPDFNLIIPGDLVGEDNGDVVLRSFGMVNVEIQAGPGQPLKLKPNVKATIKANIPSSLLASAPASIPMWYFDTNKGIWIKEGSGAKQGSTYVADVSHFSSWNCDLAYPRIYISGKLTDPGGMPVVNTLVRMRGSVVGVEIYCYTNSEGYFRVPAPLNASCSLIFNNSNCNIPFFVMPVNTGNSNINLGEIKATPNSPSWFQLSGTLQTCNNQPVQSGSLKVYVQNNMFESRINNGVAGLSFSFCNDSVDVLLVAEDFSTGKVYTGSKKLYKNINGNIGTQSICATVSQKYIRYIVDNQMYYIPGNNVDSLTCTYFATPGNPWVQVGHDNWGTSTITSKIWFNTEIYSQSVTSCIIRDYPNLSNFFTNIQLTNVFENYSNVFGTINKGKMSGRMFDTGTNQWRYIDVAYSVMQR